MELIPPGGLLAGLTKTVLETAREAEINEHLGYDKHDPMGHNGGNSRMGPVRSGCSPGPGRFRSRSRGTVTAASGTSYPITRPDRSRPGPLGHAVEDSSERFAITFKNVSSPPPTEPWSVTPEI